MKKSITAGCLVFKIFEGELKVLLVRSFGKNYWECPKGHNEFGESLRETAIRETFEESGFKASIIKQLKPIFIPREDEIKAINTHIYSGPQYPRWMLTDYSKIYGATSYDTLDTNKGVRINPLSSFDSDALIDIYKNNWNWEKYPLMCFGY